MKLSTEHQAWIESHIESGEFASVDEALSQLIAERMAAERDDLAWATPYVDAAREALRKGSVMTLDAHKALNAALLSSPDLSS